MGTLRPLLWANLQAPQFAEAFAAPPDRYRPVPWLAWTGALDWPVLRDQLADMLDKGITEFFLFPIYGMELPYMSAAYWERVGQTLEFCRDNGMKCWVYDDYNWPSGPCAGTVMRDWPDAREKLLWVRLLGEGDEKGLPPGVADPHESGGATWATAEGTVVRTTVRGGDWINLVPGYIDMLSEEACKRFIQSTHERYFARAREMFPNTIPGFFTDEPGFYSPRTTEGWVGLPYTEDLFDDFEQRHGHDLRDRLSELLGDGPTAQQTRCRYWRLVSERYSEAYGGQIRQWCDEHGVALTGHCLGEEGIAAHVRMSGDLWEALKHYAIPGIDMLANADGFTYPYRMSFYGDIDRRALHLTCKYVHGVVRHTGGREMLSEAYGVCDWGLNLMRQKRGFHYQVALGVTLFNDNSLITSIADFRKYAIAGKHFTQPWWEHYRLYADYNARVASVHAEGEPVADIAVLFPRSAVWASADESVFGQSWYHLDPETPAGQLQDLTYDLLDEMIRRQWHFDYIFEPVLEAAHVEGDELVTDHARYKALVVPSARWLPEQCVSVLREFARAGGNLIFSGDLPRYAVESLDDLSGQVEEMLKGPGALSVPASGAAICEALGDRLQRALTVEGSPAREFITSHRRIAGSDMLFVANMAQEAADVQLTVAAPGPLVMCDPDTLQYYSPPRADGEAFMWHFEPWQAFLIITGDVARQMSRSGRLEPSPLWLRADSEEVLDGEWAFELQGGNMLRPEVTIRQDPENCGAAQGWQHDTGQQGWIEPQDGVLDEPVRPGDAPWYWMRARVVCEAGAEPQTIVLDNPDFLDVFVNGRPAEPTCGPSVWTEENLAFEARGLFVQGDNHVHIRARTSKYNDPRMSAFAGLTENLLQPVVILGAFRAADDGRLVPPADRVGVDAPWEEQGIPHFAGTGVYRRTITGASGRPTLLHLEGCTDAVQVLVNDRLVGTRAWPPYVLDLTEHLEDGPNELAIHVSNTLGNLITRTYAGAQPPVYPQSGLTQPPRLLFVQT